MDHREAPFLALRWKHLGYSASLVQAARLASARGRQIQDLLADQVWECPLPPPAPQQRCAATPSPRGTTRPQPTPILVLELVPQVRRVRHVADAASEGDGPWSASEPAEQIWTVPLATHLQSACLTASETQPEEVFVWGKWQGPQKVGAFPCLPYLCFHSTPCANPTHVLCPGRVRLRRQLLL